MLFDALKAPTPRSVEPKIPKYRLHRPSGRAVMTIAGRDVYLGARGSAASKAEYRRRLGEYLASGGLAHASGGQSELTIIEIIAAYWQYICGAYKPQSRDGMIKPALRRLRLLYGQPTAPGRVDHDAAAARAPRPSRGPTSPRL